MALLPCAPVALRHRPLANSGLNCDSSVSSVCSHGTHVAGIAAGKGTTFSGVAKDANIIAIQVFSRFDDPAQCGGSAPCVMSYTSDQILGLERVYALRNTYNIASANMSLSGGSSTAPCNTASQKPIIDSLRTAGIATVIASGNSGQTSSIGSPACIESAVSVGSTTDADAVSSFTNSAYFLSLLAPGSSIQFISAGNRLWHHERNIHGHPACGRGLGGSQTGSSGCGSNRCSYRAPEYRRTDNRHARRRRQQG